jgi:hypothetical protein
MIESPFSPNKDILPPAQKELWSELILFSLSRLLRREAASLDLVFGAQAFPTSSGIPQHRTCRSCADRGGICLVLAISDCAGDSRKSWSPYSNE